MRRLLASAAALAAGWTLAGPPSPAPAELRPLNLRVAGGSAWQAENDFRLDWDDPAPSGQKSAVAAVDYVVRDGSGSTVSAAHVPSPGTTLEHLHLPPVPGRYTAELWLEDRDGNRGPSSSAELRFDDARPGDVQPLVPAAWVGTEATLRLGHPAGSPPVSGIRGYAIVVDSSPESTPCAAPDRCREEETDLAGGAGEDLLRLSGLHEGTAFVHAVAVSGSGMASRRVGSAVLHVDTTPPQTALQGLPAAWAAGPVRVAAAATDPLSGMAAAGPSGPFTAIVVDGGVPHSANGSSVTATVSGDGVHTLAFYARDAAGNDAAEEAPGPATATVRIDAAAPTVRFAERRDPADPELIEARVSDRLSGASSSKGRIAVRRAGSHAAFEPLPTAVTAGRLAARWDSGAFAPGVYEFQATGYDEAGNAATSDRRLGGARMVLPSPLREAVALEAGFGGHVLVWQHCARTGGRRHCRRETTSDYEMRPQARSVPYGKGMTFSGRVRSAAGHPLAGQPVQIVESLAPGAVPAQRTTTVETAVDGSFRAQLPPGPSRTIEAVFAGTRTLARAGSRRLRLRVESGVRLRASAAVARIGGAAVVFSGQVAALGAAVPGGGLPVELQFRLPGRPWAEFRTVQTDGRGRFRYPYAFSDDDSRGIRFEFRAALTSPAGWPYEPAASRPVFVTGR